MRVMKTILSSAVFAIGAAAGAHASIVTYDFTVTDSSHVVHDGSFSFNSTSSTRLNGDDLTSLSFNWDGVAYSTANANDGFLDFNSTGQLIGGCFGNNAFRDGCSTFGSINNWYFLIPGSFFARTGCNALGECSATGPTGPITSTQVPEPGILTLFGIALAAAGLLIRKRQPRI